MTSKPLSAKSYGHIPHLPSSRVGVGDHTIGAQQGAIATTKCRRTDRVIVQEKLDGSNVAVVKLGGKILALIRAGYLASDSPREMHHRFAAWVETERARFDILLSEGERVCGEWMIQAHGTRYRLPHEPFVPFDIMVGINRLTVDATTKRLRACGFTVPNVLSDGPALSIADAVARLSTFGAHGAIDPVEGAVWRVETEGKFNFICKWVRPDKNDRLYLRDAAGIEIAPTWNEWVGRIAA